MDFVLGLWFGLVIALAISVIERIWHKRSDHES